MDTAILQFLAAPFAASLILTGIHTYLGVHVVERGVIFVDLSLAQIAALGSTAAYLAGYDLHSGMAYLFSLGFTFIGAVVFAFTRVHRRTRIPQEAVIGIVYAVSAAAAILVMSKATQETEHLKEMKFDIRDGRALTMPATKATVVHEVRVTDGEVFVQINDA